MVSPLEERLCPDINDKVATWSRFAPVHMTCSYTSDVILKTAKELLKPVFIDQATPKALDYKITISKILGKAVIAGIQQELGRYLRSANVGHKEGQEGVELSMLITGNTCW